MRTLRFLLPTILAMAPAACLDEAPIDEALNDELATGEKSSELLLGPNVVCVGTETTINTPGLLILPQVVTSVTTTIYAPCTSSDPTLIQGIAVTTTAGPRSCLDLVVPSTGVQTIAWNNGQTSTFAFNAITTDVLGSQLVISSGAIALGAFAGHAALDSAFGVSLNLLACLAPPGLTAQIAATSLVIL